MIRRKLRRDHQIAIALVDSSSLRGAPIDTGGMTLNRELAARARPPLGEERRSLIPLINFSMEKRKPGTPRE